MVLALGGEFGLSVATQSYFAGSALAELEGAESEAAEHLEQAVALYDAGPGPGEQHWFGGRALAGVDLAAPIFQRSPQARELDERIEEFGFEPIAAELHDLPGSPG